MVFGVVAAPDAAAGGVDAGDWVGTTAEADSFAGFTGGFLSTVWRGFGLTNESMSLIFTALITKANLIRNEAQPMTVTATKAAAAPSVLCV